jgi:TATA-box binding protein (TBP) (component of TFIID and TFIIIB)
MMKSEEKENMDETLTLKEEPNASMCFTTTGGVSAETSATPALAESSIVNNNTNTNCSEPSATDSASAPAQNDGHNVDIIINNVVCNFSVRCHLNLKLIAQTGANVEFHKEMAMLIMKFRRPRCTASIWSSGKITMTGTTTEDDARKGARRCARAIQKLGFNVRFTNFRVVNVLGTCTMPFAIKIADFSSAHPRLASYEPELHPGVTFKLKDIPATLKIFSTGSITITGPRVQNVQKAVEDIYSLVYEYKKDRRADDLQQYPIAERKKMRLASRLLKEKQNGNACKRTSAAAKNKQHPPKKRVRVSDDIEGTEEEEEEDLASTSESEEEPFDIKSFKTPIEVDEDDLDDDDDLL